MAKYLVGIAIVLGACGTVAAQPGGGPGITTWGVDLPVLEHEMVFIEENGDGDDHYNITLSIDYSVPAGETGKLKVFIKDNSGTWVEFYESANLTGEIANGNTEVSHLILCDNSGASSGVGTPTIGYGDTGEWEFKAEIFDTDDMTTPEASDTETFYSTAYDLGNSWSVTLRNKVSYDAVSFMSGYDKIGWDDGIAIDGFYTDYEVGEGHSGVLVVEVINSGSGTDDYTWGIWYVTNEGERYCSAVFTDNHASGVLDRDTSYTIRAWLFDADDWNFNSDSPIPGRSAKASDSKVVTP